MSLFVHLTPEANLARILHSGIRKSRPSKRGPGGVYAMPVTRNFYASHQWLRELKRSGVRTIVGVYFRIPDSEPVLIGHYSKPHATVSAAQAEAIITAAPNPEGYEVLVGRRIDASEIQRSRALPQVLGWRYFPAAHGRKPCGCPACLGKGEIKSRQIRTRFEQSD